MAVPPRVPKHRVSGGLRSFNVQQLTPKPKNVNKKFLVSGKTGSEKERSCHFEPKLDGEPF
jgi:hypothetical protein